MNKDSKIYDTGDIVEHSTRGLGVVVNTYVDGAYGRNVIVVHWMNEGKEEIVWQWAMTVQPVKRISQ
jgi:hypothetical protein